MDCKRTLLGKIKIKLSIKITKPRDTGKTEAITPRKDWMALEPGDYIISRKSGLKRKIISKNRGSVEVIKVRGIGTTVYADCDRAWFIPMKRKNANINSV